MNREQKEIVVDEIAAQLKQADAVLAVDYRGIDVVDVAELRARLREADTTFRVVKNTLSLRAADKAGVEPIKQHLVGPTAFALVNGDVALAAKALDGFSRRGEAISFKGGVIDNEALTVEQLKELARLPSRAQLNAQLAGIVASPLTTLVRGLNSLISGLAIALAEVHRKRAAEEPPQEVVESGAEAEQEPKEEEGKPGEEAVGKKEALTEEAPEVKADLESGKASEDAEEKPPAKAGAEPEEVPKEPAAQEKARAEKEPSAKADLEPGKASEDAEEKSPVKAKAEPEEAPKEPAAQEKAREDAAEAAKDSSELRTSEQATHKQAKDF